MPGAFVIGAGPGLGGAIARRFARAHMPVALVARTAGTVAAVAAGLAPSGVPVAALTADCADESALRAALDAAVVELGPPDVVVYNAAVVRPDAPGDLSARAQLDAWAVNVVGALTTATHIAPLMAARGGGSFLVTGGMPVPKAAYVSLSLGKAGLRTLVDLLAERYGPLGVHVASVTVDGPIAPATAFDPDMIAEHYWTLHTQPRHRWHRDILHTAESAARATFASSAPCLRQPLRGRTGRR
ncbi:SDR family NAD(P)-dependent oxidoreductase [Streptomyces sp. SBT349]|uniref:SDR family NAD(P)-dependent oxidoreductase n=1 Tax=Streptomyces sp. SBT349 TaxID=1580539 RepID=UPI0007C7A04A|nr:SDR family NAD(P)-dependent oxidoreductase [Streptomyces sp. SBT349]